MPNYLSPGVYIEELNVFPSTVAQVETAIPAFVGYTEKAQLADTYLNNRPYAIHSLAKEYEAIGKHTEAFKVLRYAKAEKRGSIGYQFCHDEPLFDLAAPGHLDTANTASEMTQKQTIFVIGMPRSGTTLVERIISNHSDVSSCGELQDFGLAVKELTATPSNNVLDIDTLKAAKMLDFSALGKRYLQRTVLKSGNKKCFVDKLPFNFFYIDLILRALPHAKIICVLRNQWTLVSAISGNGFHLAVLILVTPII